MSTFNNLPPGHLPPLVSVDATHQRASIIIATSLLLFTTLLFVGARLWVRSHPEEGQGGGNVSGGLDDILIATSTVLYAIHCVLLLVACKNGLGDTNRSIPKLQLESLQKCYYAAIIFYVLSLGCCNGSVSYLLVRINGSGNSIARKLMLALTVIAAIWTVAMAFVFVFACGTTSPWTIIGQRCTVWQFPRWVALGVSVCIFETGIPVFATWSFWSLQLPFSKKAGILVMFALRLPMIIIIALQLSSYDINAFSTDYTLRATVFICLTEMSLSYSICSANFPAFRRLTRDIRTDFGGFGNTSNPNASSFSSGYLRSQRSAHQPESDTFPMTAYPTTSAERRPTTKLHVIGEPVDDEVGYSCEARHDDTTSLSSNNPSEHRSEDRIIRARTDVIVTHDYA